MNILTWYEHKIVDGTLMDNMNVHSDTRSMLHLEVHIKSIKVHNVSRVAETLKKKFQKDPKTLKSAKKCKNLQQQKNAWKCQKTQKIKKNKQSKIVIFFLNKQTKFVKKKK